MEEYLKRNQDGRPPAYEGGEAYALRNVDYKGPSMQRQNTIMVHNAYPDGTRFYEDESPTISTPAGGSHLPDVAEGQRIRRLTPKECERLQGFPDDWTAGVSDTQRYKQMGNAVSVPVIKAIGDSLLAAKEDK